MISPHFSLSFPPVPISERLALLYVARLALIYRAFVLFTYFLSIALKSLSQGTIQAVPEMTMAITGKKLLKHGAWVSLCMSLVCLINGVPYS